MNRSLVAGLCLSLEPDVFWCLVDRNRRLGNQSGGSQREWFWPIQDHGNDSQKSIGQLPHR
jgi:hypothetical protein